MGTTLTALGTDEGVAFQWVLAIEGFEYLITDGPTAAAVTAWAATPFASAIGGLYVDGNFEQSLDPWEPIKSAGDATFVVRDCDGSDVLGLRIFKRHATETSLTVEADNNDTTLTVQSTSGLTGADVYIGVERVGFSGSTGTTFTGCDRGKFSPFNRNGASDHEFGRYHRISDSDLSPNVKPLVSSVPRVWSGKWVGLWMHRKVAGVLDTKAEAQLIFAGKIADIRENEVGDVVINAAHVIESAAEATVLDSQFRITFAEGLRLSSADQDSRVAEIVTYNGTTAKRQYLTCVPSGAVSAYEINEGVYRYSEIIEKINRMLTLAYQATDLNLLCELRLVDSSGPRVEFATTFGGSSGEHATLGLHHSVAVMLGMADAADTQAFESLANTGTTIEIRQRIVYFQLAKTSSETKANIVGASAPYRVLLLPNPRQNDSSGRGTPEYYEIAYSDYGGTFVAAYDSYFDQFGALRLADDTADTGNRFLLSVNGYTLLATWTTGGGDPVLNIYADYKTIPTASDKPYTALGIREGEDGELIGTQTVVLSGDLATTITALFASTATAGYNHATYDKGFSGPSIPWDLLGTGFVTSLQQIDAGTESRATLILDKPTTIKELLSVDMVLRRAHLVWRNGALRWVTWATPVDADTLPALTEANKASSEQSDKQITVSSLSDQWVRNVVKVEYDRGIGTEVYHRTVVAEDAASIGDLGRALPITLKARNAFSINGNGHGVQRVERLLPDFLAWLPTVSRPVLLIRRTINFSLFENFGVGSIVRVSDNYVRDAETGTRGISAKVGIVVGHRYSYGGSDPGNWQEARPIFGEVDVVLMGDELIGDYCPAAEVDDTADAGGFTNGWNSGTSVLRTVAQKYQTAAAYDASFFAVNDEIQVIEIDPDVGTTPAGQNATITAISTRDITLDASVTLAAGQKYRVIPRKYADCTTTQRANRAFVCDDSDGLVQNLRRGLVFAAPENVNTQAAADESTLATLVHTGYSDEGMPLDVGVDFAMAGTINNLIGHRTMQCNPQMLEVPESGGAMAANMILLFPQYVPGLVEDPSYAERTRLVIAPLFRSTSGSTATVIVTVSQFPPRSRSDGTSNASSPRWSGAFKQFTWTTTSTTVAEGAAETFDIRDVSAPEYPFIFIAVQLFGTATEFHGLPKNYYLPPEA